MVFSLLSETNCLLPMVQKWHRPTDRIIKNKYSKKQPSINLSSSLPGRVKTVKFSCLQRHSVQCRLIGAFFGSLQKDTCSFTDGRRVASSYSPRTKIVTTPFTQSLQRVAQHTVQGAVWGEAPLQPSSLPVHLSELWKQAALILSNLPWQAARLPTHGTCLVAVSVHHQPPWLVPSLGCSRSRGLGTSAKSASARAHPHRRSQLQLVCLTGSLKAFKQVSAMVRRGICPQGWCSITSAWQPTCSFSIRKCLLPYSAQQGWTHT